MIDDWEAQKRLIETLFPNGLEDGEEVLARFREEYPGMVDELLDLLARGEVDPGDSRLTEILDMIAVLGERTSVWIGHYRILETLGEGGMGEVYLARQDKPIKRQVAVKVIRKGLATREMLARFASEYQALAALNHGNIVQIFESGTTDEGSPYFSMEYFPGLPINRYVEVHHCSLEVRLRLMIQACEGVLHAHRRGIIHRDLKPSNIMVCEQNDLPVVKIIDFGIAKALNGPLTDLSLHTNRGQVLGTPAYMSPEQTGLSDAEIDTRTDIYGLGAVLFEVLTGKPPFDMARLKKMGWDEMLACIRDEEPGYPSRWVQSQSRSTDGSGDGRIWAKRISGELDWIVAKAMAKERAHRYESAHDLALDLKRFLADEPVAAGPPSVSYHLKKFLKRNKAWVSAAAFAVFALFGGATAALYSWQRALRAESETLAMEAEKQKAFDAIKEIFTEANPYAGGADTRVVDVLDRWVDTMSDRFKDQPLVQAEILRYAGGGYFGLGSYGKASQILKKAYELYRDNLPESHPDLIETHLELIRARDLLGDRDRLESELDSVIDGIRKHSGLLKQSLIAMRRKSSLRERCDDLSSARGILEKVLHDIPVDKEYDRFRYNTLRSLGKVNRRLEDYDKAEVCYVKAEKGLARILGEKHPETLLVRHQMVNLYLKTARLDEASEILLANLSDFTDVLGADHPETLNTRHALVRLLRRQGRYDEALAEGSLLLESLVRVLGAHHRDVLGARENLALIYGDLGDLDMAISQLQDVARIQKEVPGMEKWHRVRVCNNLANFLMRAGRLSESEILLRDNLGVLGHENSQASRLWPVKLLLGENLLKQNRTEEAVVYLESVVRESDESGRSRNPNRIVFLGMYGVGLEKLGRFEEAETMLLAAVNNFNHKDRIYKSVFIQSLIALYTRWGKLDQAEVWTRALEDVSESEKGEE